MTAPSCYDAARQSAAVAPLPERAILAATGPHRQKFLHGVLSNDVEGLAAGQGTLAALMDAKGHITALMRALVTPDAVLLEMPADRLEPVERTLSHYRVAAPVRFGRQPTTVLAVLGPKAHEILAAAGCPIEVQEPQGHQRGRVAGHDVRVQRSSDLPADGYAVHVAPESATAVEQALRSAGAAPLTRDVLDALRIEDGRPWYGPDVTEENLLHETGLIAEYHSPTKGCYVGQEVVARLEARGGNVNKRLRGFRLGAATSAGQPVLSQGKEVGRLTTAASSPRFGPIAMGYVHRSQAEPGTVVEVAGAAAAVADFPFRS
jgi:folate-binding protein YgfZ